MRRRDEADSVAYDTAIIACMSTTGSGRSQARIRIARKSDAHVQVHDASTLNTALAANYAVWIYTCRRWDTPTDTPKACDAKVSCKAKRDKEPYSCVGLEIWEIIVTATRKR
jgi:hypothetical protein